MKGKIFNAQEVQSMIAGNKTQFREVIKFSEIEKKIMCKADEPYLAELIKCPYKVGQKIFCKESFLQKLGSTQLPSGEYETFFTGSKVEYLVDGAQERWVNPDTYYSDYWKKRPAQHMKQEHSRLTLQIKEIMVERLVDISEEDAIAEGIEKMWLQENEDFPRYEVGKHSYFNPKKTFEHFWNATHKKPEEKFDANPWVWVIDFEVVK